MGKNRDATKTDFSSFMCIILMLTGCLVTIMISNIVVISANPENVQITSVMTEEIETEEMVDEEGNIRKNPWYLEVARDHVVIHPGDVRIEIRDLEASGNAFEQLLERVKERAEREYIVLLIRPYGAATARRIKRTIVDRGIDIGLDLLQKDVPVHLRNPRTNQVATASATPP